MHPPPLYNSLSDVSDEVAENFLSGCAGARVGSEMLPPLMLGRRDFGVPRSLQPSNPGTRCLQSSRGLSCFPIAGNRKGDNSDRLLLARLSASRLPTLRTPLPSFGGSVWTVFQMPLPGQPPRLPQAWSEGPKREQRVPATKAAKTVGAKMKPLPALTAGAFAAAAGASLSPARRAQCATAPPRSRFQDPLRVDSAARGSASLRAGAGRGLTCQSCSIKPIRMKASSPGPKHRPIG